MAKADSSEPEGLAPNSAPVRNLGFEAEYSSAPVARASDADLSEIVSLLINSRPGPQPASVSPLLYLFLDKLRSGMNAEESRVLWPFAARLVDSGLEPGAETLRLVRLTDWTIREVLSLALESSGLVFQARAVRKCEPIETQADCRQAEQVARAAYFAAGAAADAATPGSVEALSARAARAAAESATGAAVFAQADRPRDKPIPRSMLSAQCAIDCVESAASAGAERKVLIEMQVAILDQLCPASDPSSVDFANNLAE